MKYYDSVRAEMEAKYNRSFDNIKIKDLYEVLSGRDYDKFLKALKYPNGIIRRVLCATM